MLKWFESQTFKATPLLVPLFAAACSPGFEPPSRVSTVRVLAVEPTPASGTPGQASELVMLVHDGTPEGAGDAELQIAWFGGCHNPPTRQFFACYPLLSEIAKNLSPRAVDTPADSVPSFLFGTGPVFQFAVPPDILSAAPKLPTDPIHFGVSYAFFAVCKGELRPLPNAEERVPLGCFDAETDEELGAEAFVTGFTTLFTFEDDVNENPIVSGISIAGERIEPAFCATDDDCAGSGPEIDGSEGYACSERGACVPVVDACEKPPCVQYSIEPEVDRASAEPDLGAKTSDGVPNEIVWVDFFATAGAFQTDSQLINDRKTGWVEGYWSKWTAPRAPGAVTLWTTVHDNRGGVSWASLDLIVR
jgi:hypothetical protein